MLESGSFHSHVFTKKHEQLCNLPYSRGIFVWHGIFDLADKTIQQVIDVLESYPIDGNCIYEHEGTLGISYFYGKCARFKKGHLKCGHREKIIGRFLYIANFFILFQQKYNIQIFEEGYLWSICEYLGTIPITSPGDKTASLHSGRIAEDKVGEFRSLLQRSQDMESERIIQIRDEFVAALESILMIPGNFDPKIQSLYTSCQPITNLLAK